MFTWNLEDMALLNDKGGFFIGREQIFSCENTLSRAEKIAFVDSMQNNKLSYILNIIERFQADVDSLPKDSHGCVKTVSLKAWIKRNTVECMKPLVIFDTSYNYGYFSFLGIHRSIVHNYNCMGRYDTYDDIVDEAFHRQLKKCKEKEREYFLAHDEYSILKEKFRNKNFNTTFGVNIAMCSTGEIYVFEDDRSFYDKDNYYRKITIEELKYLLSKYEELDKLVEKITKETNIKF